MLCPKNRVSYSFRLRPQAEAMLSCSTARRSSFPIATLLGRRPVVAQRTRQVIPFHVFLQRDRCECCPGSKQVVATAVAWRIGHHRATIRRGGLRKAPPRGHIAP